MLIHHDKKRWARDKNAADRPVTLSKPAETINSALALTLHNGLHRRGHSSSMSHSMVIGIQYICVSSVGVNLAGFGNY